MRGVKIPVKRSQAKGGLSPDLLAEYVLRGPQSGLKSPRARGYPSALIGSSIGTEFSKLCPEALRVCSHTMLEKPKTHIAGFLCAACGIPTKRVALKIRPSKAFMLAVQNKPLL